MNTKQIYICRYNFSESKCQWLLTDNATYALSIDPNFQLANLADLHDWVAATGEVFTGILSVREGECKWIDRNYIDEFGEISYEYKYELL